MTQFTDTELITACRSNDTSVVLFQLTHHPETKLLGQELIREALRYGHSELATSIQRALT